MLTVLNLIHLPSVRFNKNECENCLSFPSEIQHSNKWWALTHRHTDTRVKHKTNWKRNANPLLFSILNDLPRFSFENMHRISSVNLPTFEGTRYTKVEFEIDSTLPRIFKCSAYPSDIILLRFVRFQFSSLFFKHIELEMKYSKGKTISPFQCAWKFAKAKHRRLSSSFGLLFLFFWNGSARLSVYKEKYKSYFRCAFLVRNASSPYTFNFLNHFYFCSFVVRS